MLQSTKEEADRSHRAALDEVIKQRDGIEEETKRLVGAFTALEKCVPRLEFMAIVRHCRVVRGHEVTCVANACRA